MYEKTKNSLLAYPDNLAHALNYFGLKAHVSGEEAEQELEKGAAGERNTDMIRRYFRDNEKLADIGKAYNLTSERVRQLINVGLRDIRADINGRLPVC